MTEERRREDQRISKLVSDVCELKKSITYNNEITNQVRDTLASFRVIAAVAKWVTAIAVAAAAVVTAWQSFKQ